MNLIRESKGDERLDSRMHTFQAWNTSHENYVIPARITR